MAVIVGRSERTSVEGILAKFGFASSNPALMLLPHCIDLIWFMRVLVRISFLKKCIKLIKISLLQCTFVENIHLVPGAAVK